MWNRKPDNLLDETLGHLAARGLTPKDVLWVGSQDGKYRLTWRGFAKLAKDTNYDSGYGSQEVVGGLVVVGKNWWLERYEYGGSEGWVFKRLPQLVDAPKRFKTVLIAQGGFSGRDDDDE